MENILHLGHVTNPAHDLHVPDQHIFCRFQCKYLIDNFGTDFECEPVDADHFKATVSVCTSTTFYRWVFGFNGKIKIAGPQNVTTIYKELLQKALDEA